MIMTSDDDNRILKTSNEIATVTFLLLFGVYVCVQFSLLTEVIIMTGYMNIYNKAT